MCVRTEVRTHIDVFSWLNVNADGRVHTFTHDAIRVGLTNYTETDWSTCIPSTRHTGCHAAMRTNMPTHAHNCRRASSRMDGDTDMHTDGRPGLSADRQQSWQTCIHTIIPIGKRYTNRNQAPLTMHTHSTPFMHACMHACMHDIIKTVDHT